MPLIPILTAWSAILVKDSSIAYSFRQRTRLLHLPLTMLRQPCQEMGMVALAAMLTRMTYPTLSAPLLNATLIVRRSCGSNLGTETLSPPAEVIISENRVEFE